MYNKLGEREIRLLILEPGAASDPLNCHLKVERINKSLKFEALSYEWKENHGSARITCANTTCSITRNLADALHAFRSPESSKVLWVDAVCINQEDGEEKSKQIPLMSEIFASAKLVHVWLGRSFRGVEEAFGVFRYLALLGLRRHSTGEPDMEDIKDILDRSIEVRPKHGSIRQGLTGVYHFSHDKDTIISEAIDRDPELTDDVAFKFDDNACWEAIDRLFGNSYFQRSWIIQEVAVAEMVSIACGQHRMHWDIFRLAYEGRMRLLFQPQRTISYIPCVSDARIRFRDYERPRAYDLGVVLTSFTYSKEKNPRDKIYAALGIVRPRSSCKGIIPDYNKSVARVFYEASCHIIQERKDVFLWSTKTLSCRRKLRDLPTWVPEWTMEPCEEAVEFASPTFSRCIQADPSICDEKLFLNGCLMDIVDKTYSINNQQDIFRLVIGLDAWLKAKDKHMFGVYSRALEDCTPKRLLDSDVEARKLLLEFQNMPPFIAQIIRNIRDRGQHPLADDLLNMEALWATLMARFQKRTKHKPLGHHLFLAMLYVIAMVSQSGTIDGGFPKPFDWWIVAATVINFAAPKSADFQKLFCSHFECLYSHFECLDSVNHIEDCFFVTKSGYFGRAPAEVVRPGQFVAIIGGAYVPCLLAKRKDHYQLVSHAYIQGIMTMETLPTGLKTERILMK